MARSYATFAFSRISSINLDASAFVRLSSNSSGVPACSHRVFKYDACGPGHRIIARNPFIRVSAYCRSFRFRITHAWRSLFEAGNAPVRRNVPASRSGVLRGLAGDIHAQTRPAMKIPQGMIAHPVSWPPLKVERSIQKRKTQNDNEQPPSTWRRCTVARTHSRVLPQHRSQATIRFLRESLRAFATNRPTAEGFKRYMKRAATRRFASKMSCRAVFPRLCAHAHQLIPAAAAVKAAAANEQHNHNDDDEGGGVHDRSSALCSAFECKGRA